MARYFQIFLFILFQLMVNIGKAYAGGNFTLPVDVPSITSGYSDLRAYDTDGVENDIHGGVDFDTADSGTSIYSVYRGTVQVGGMSSLYGNHVLVFHDTDGDGLSEYTSLYAHLSIVSVVDGDFVQRGEKLGEGGKTGNVTGSHLHFEIRVGEVGSTLDPYNIYEDLGSEYPDYNTTATCGSNHLWTQCPPVVADTCTPTPVSPELVVMSEDNGAFDLHQYYVSDEDGDGQNKFTLTDANPVINNQGSSLDAIQWLSGDVNGDGYTDLVLVSFPTTSWVEVSVWLSNFYISIYSKHSTNPHPQTALKRD